MGKHIAVDLDGTLAHYDGWKGDENIGKPIEATVERLEKFLASDLTNCYSIFTARMSSGVTDQETNLDHISSWVKRNGLPEPIHITATKHKKFSEFWDDRAIPFIPNGGATDTGTHYRVGYKGIQLDPARICNVYGITNILQGAIIKKTLKAGQRGKKDIIADIDDIITAAIRWKEMVLEDES